MPIKSKRYKGDVFNSNEQTNRWVAKCRLAMCRITICRQKSKFLTDRTKISRFVENVTTRGKLCRPLGRRVARCLLRLQTFARPFTSVLSVIARHENDVSVVKNDVSTNCTRHKF